LGLSVTTVRWRIRVARARLEALAAEQSPRRLPAIVVWLWPWHSARLMPRLVWIFAVIAIASWLGRGALRGQDESTEPTRVERAQSWAAAEPRAKVERKRVRDDAGPMLELLAITIGGRVIDERGAAIADAHVCAALDPSQRTRVDDLDPTCTKSGADGRYQLDRVAPGLHRIGASARGFIPGDHAGRNHVGTLLARAQEQHHDVDIVLRAGGVAITGTVLDETGGVVPSALVRGQDFTRFGNGWTATAIADDEGRFELWAPRGGVAVTASAAGYSLGTADAVAPQRGLEVRLMPEVTVAGRVVDTEGAGVEGVRVNANSDAHNSEEQYISTTTDAAGNFVLRRLRPGRYRPIASSSHAYGEAAYGVLATLDEPAPPITITVEPAHALEIDVVTDEVLEDCDGEWLEAWGASRHAARVVDGQVLLDGLLDGAYALRLECHGVSVDQSVAIAGADLGVELRVAASTTIAGRVAGSGTLGPYLGITVAPAASVPTGPMRPAGAVTTRADADGHFVVAVAGTGSYTVYGATVAGTQLPLGTFDVVADRRLDVGELAIPALGRIEGAVIDADGAGVSGLQVIASGATGLGTTTRPDGTFEMVDLPPGRYELVARRRSVAIAGADPVETMVAADAAAVVSLSVPRQNAHLGGRVVTDTDAPVADALVVVRAEGSAEPIFREVARVHTDVDGRFVAKQLAHGDYTLEVRLGRLAWGSLHATTSGGPSTIVLGERTSIAGRVVDAQGQPLTTFTLAVTGAAGELGHVVRDRDGAWRAADLPRGRYEVSARGLADADCRGQTAIDVDEPKDDVVITCVRSTSPP
ncbi:MAG TPA: carboxypeptidase-like regulatory domain-containing protein, partial [Nannocystaceae bacterium]|nr:carboxypeptidase-like regulatory domain-containing protein [Nannocystaceae bacterium]